MDHKAQRDEGFRPHRRSPTSGRSPVPIRRSKPAQTDTASSTWRRAGASRPTVHARIARNERRLLPFSELIASVPSRSRRATISPGYIARVRAAASSIASGNPSSLTSKSRTSHAVASSIDRNRPMARARARNRDPAADDFQIRRRRRARQIERLDGDLDFAADPQRNPAGRQDPKARGSFEQAL